MEQIGGRRRWVPGWAVWFGIGAFLLVGWPTCYRWDSYLGRPVQIDRWNGSYRIMTDSGWTAWR